MVAPTLIDCWHVRDLQRFRAVLKGGADRTAAGALSSSGSYGASYSKSPHSSSTQLAGPCPPSEVNRRDLLGRSALHLIASSTEPASVDYLHALLSHPSVNVNLQDTESGWTALHRALYSANLITALILLRRTDLDTRIKDLEGLTPFDLYNSTVAGTNPLQEALSWDASTGSKGRALCQLFSWGSNRNFTLGLGDGDDRQLPDRVHLRREADLSEASRKALAAGKRFDRIGVRDVVMGRMHTVILTDEKVSNVWICGIGGNGRLGKAPQTQPRLEPLQDFRETARSVAVAQDHTIIVTESGAAFSFGLNRFQQLGYTIEQGQGTVASSSGSGRGVAFGPASTGPSTGELDVQISPRRIAGVLKKDSVLGAAASKLHSAVFTADGLYTWGTNMGQLGYDRGGTPVQVLPRRVTGLAQGTGIKQVAATEFGTACLLDSWDVILFHNDTHYRINFPLSRFSSDISVFRPRQVQPKSWVTKLTSSGNTFAALSDMGDLFTFNLEHPSEYGASGRGGSSTSSQGQSRMAAAHSAPRPQLVWSVRKKFTAVRDVAIGADGSVILCTESGHVYVRSRKGDGSSKAAGKSFKFQAVPYLQRVVKVAINETGALAAIKVDPPLPEVRMRGRTVEEALRDLLPHLKVRTIGEDGEKEHGISAEVVQINDAASMGSDDAASDDESEDGDGRAIKRTTHDRQVNTALLLAEAAKRWGSHTYSATRSKESETGNQPAQADADHSVKVGRGLYGPHNLTPPFGCDAFLIAGERYLPVHRVVLAARIPVLREALANPAAKIKVPEGVQVKKLSDTVASVVLPACSFGTALFFLHYIYSDTLSPVWTPSIGILVEKELKAVKIDRMQVQRQLRQLAELLELSVLEAAIRSPIINPLGGTLREDLLGFFTAHVDVDAVEASPFRDVEIELEDRIVPAHSAILRRSPFFAALFQPQWTLSRWTSRNIIRIDMRHLRWQVARIVLMHLYTDLGEAVFLGTDVDRTMEQFMDFVVEVMAASNELLLDKLKLVCSSLLRNRVLSQNVGAVMTEADFYQAGQLKDITMDYCTRNLESLLESGMLVELEHKMLRELTGFVRHRQDEKMRRTFAQDSVFALVEKHRDYYDDLDIPAPSLHLIANKLQPKKGPAQVQVRSPILVAADASRRRPTINGRNPSPPYTSPELRPISETPTKKAAGDPSMMFTMDEDDLDTSRKDVTAGRSGNSGISGSPWAVLPSMAQLSLDETSTTAARSASPASQPWRARTVEAEKRAQSVEVSPALRPTRLPDSASDLRSIMMSQEQQQHQQVLRRSTAASPAGSGTTTPNLRSATSGGGGAGVDITPLAFSSSKLSQKDRKKLQQQQVAATAAAVATTNGTQQSSTSSVALGRPTTPAASPWKLPPPAQSSPGTAAFSPEGGATPSSWGARASASSDAARTAGTPQRRPAAAPLQSPAAGRGSTSVDSGAKGALVPPTTPLGPTFTPTRMQSTTVQRRVSSGEAAWATPSIAPSTSYLTSAAQVPLLPASTQSRVETSHRSDSSTSTSQLPRASNLQRSLGASGNGAANGPSAASSSPSGPSGPSAPLTFAQIQEQQRMAEVEQSEQLAAISKRSFIDIIAEEKEEEERRKVELKQQEEFEKWFEEESKRIQKEGGGGSKKGRGSKGGPRNNNAAGGASGSGGSGGGGGAKRGQASNSRANANQASASGSSNAGKKKHGAQQKQQQAQQGPPPRPQEGRESSTPSDVDRGGDGRASDAAGEARDANHPGRKKPQRHEGPNGHGNSIPKARGDRSKLPDADPSQTSPSKSGPVPSGSASAAQTSTAASSSSSPASGLSIRAPAFVPSRLSRQ